MSANSRAGGIAPPRFHVSVHLLLCLARTEEICSSAEMAAQVQSHATFLRRVLAPLVRAGIVDAREGRVGGYRLARSADRITLGEVYSALRAAAVQATEGTGCEPGCGAAAEILDRVLDEILKEAEDRVVALLSRYTIADLARRVER